MSKNELPLWARAGHKKPVSRRELLSSGLLSFSASLFIPTIFDMLASPAYGATCDSASGPSLMPFVTLNLAGGAMMAANFVPHDKGQQPLSTYNKMGLGVTPSLVNEFGKVPFFSKSMMLQGMRTTASTETLANTAFVAACVQSRDDSRDNKFDISRVVQLAGRKGTLMPNLGVANTATGLNQNFAMLEPETPLIVKSFNDIKNSLSYAGPLLNLKTSQKQSLAKFISRLTASQTEKLKTDASASEFANVFECASIQNSQLIQQGGGDIDPRANLALARLWGIESTAASPSATSYIFASMIYNCLKGNTGVANIEIGGFDYHDRTRTTGNRKDQEAGELIGRLLESAKILQSPLFLYVCSDGACTSPVSSDDQAPWLSDRGSAGTAFMICYSPKGRPATKSFQLGYFTSDQAASDATAFGNNPEKASAAIFANYLAANAKLDLFDRIARGTFDPKLLPDLTIFGA